MPMFSHCRRRLPEGGSAARVRGGAGCRARRDSCSDGVSEAELRRAKNMVGRGFLARRLDHRRQGAAAGRVRGHARRSPAAVRRAGGATSASRATDVLQWRARCSTPSGAPVGVPAAAWLGAASCQCRIPPHQRHTLDNGVKLILLPRHDVPLIAFEAVVRGGARLDRRGTRRGWRR